jgi:glutathione synthase/RimK-type ligase-like ATP-grasp enzyme
MKAKDPVIAITGCGGTPAYNVVTSLRRVDRPWRIIGLDCDQYRIRLMKGFDRKYLVPSSSESDYITAMNRVLEAEGVEFLHPQTDVEVGVVSEKRQQVQARMMLPDDDVVQLCHDKYRLIERLRMLKIPAARSFLIKNNVELRTAMDQIGPKMWVRAIRGAAGRGSLPVEKIDHARMWIDYWNGLGSFAAEEYLPGRNYGWQAVYDRGELKGSIAWERLQYVMQSVAPSGVTGTTAIARYINNDEVHEMGRRTVEAVDPHPTGIFGVDMKESSAGVPCVTEINVGRFYQPSYMFAAAGYNIVQLFFNLALNEGQSGDFPIRAKVPENRYWIRGIDVPPVLCDIDNFIEPGQPCDS